jgi:MFS transporter, ACS family, allantoate permease
MVAESKGVKSDVVPGEMEESASSISPGRVDAQVDGNVDVAAKYANQFTNGDSYSLSEWGRLRWKLDLRLVPLLWFNVTLGAMDKITTSTAALYGFREDTDLYGDRYSWVGSAFYVSDDIAPYTQSVYKCPF